jgi:polar amino acid transport system substrate-binding protein
MDRKVIRRFTWLHAAALAIAVGGLGSVQAQSPATDRIDKQKTLRVGWAVWHPYVYRDSKSNQVQGISYDLLQELGKSMGVKIEWVEDSWSTLPAGLQANKFEITNLMAITPPRAQVVDFSEAVTQHGLSLLAPQAEVAKTRSWEDWDRPGVKIAVTLGANSDMFVTEKFKRAEIVRLKTVPENVLALVSGRVNAHASTIDALRTIQKEHPNLAIVPGSFGSSEVAFALPKGDADLAKHVNHFVREAKRTGRVNQLLEKYGLDSSFAAN